MKPAILSIDMMHAYFDVKSPLRLPSASCLRVAAEVIAAASLNSVPVIHTKVQYGPGGADGGVFIRKVPALWRLIGETPDGRSMRKVAPLPDEAVIIKQYASAFVGTGLGSLLQAQGVDTVVIVGTSTSGCVRATAVDAIQHGFIPIVVSDGVGDRTEEVHRASLYDLQSKYAEVMDSRAAMRKLQGC